MSVETVWHDDEQTVVRHIFTGRWTLPELRESLDTFAGASIIGDDVPIYYISDVRESAILPKGILAHVDDFRDVLSNDESITVIVGASYLMQIIVRSLQKMGIANTMVFVNTLAEAEVLIAEHKQQVRVSR